MRGPQLPTGIHAVVFDVGETLVDESRAWAARAKHVGVTSLTLMGVLGSLIERGEDHRGLWAALGVAPPTFPPRIEEVDLYPDALACLRAVRRAGMAVGVAGNQPAGAVAQLRAAGIEADVVASSADWGVAKPASEFFARVSDAIRLQPEEILYVGDRLDNDVLPARAAGMRTAFIRRGPWGHIHARRPEAARADVLIGSLAELTSALTAID